MSAASSGSAWSSSTTCVKVSPTNNYKGQPVMELGEITESMVNGQGAERGGGWLCTSSTGRARAEIISDRSW